MRFHGIQCLVTSAEVFAVIRARHQCEAVFSSFSDPTGTFNGGPGTQGTMETAFGMHGHDYPLIGVRTTWTIYDQGDHKRHNEKHEYYLFSPENTVD